MPLVTMSILWLYVNVEKQSGIRQNVIVSWKILVLIFIVICVVWKLIYHYPVSGETLFLMIYF